MVFAFFCTFFAVGTKTRAGVSDNVSGWSWGGSGDGVNNTGLGWVSFNNVTGGGSVSYGVNIPVSGQITGYAFVENLGYVDFNPHAGCPGSPKYPGACDPFPTTPAQDATRNLDNTVTGWARFVDIAKENAVGNSGGWTGWVHLNDTASSKYGVNVDSVTGKLFGSAWSGDFVDGVISGPGYISISGATYGSLLPNVTLTASPITIDVDANPGWATANGNKGTAITLNWVVTGMTNCVKSADSGAVWAGSVNANGSEVVYQNKPTVRYALTCDNGVGVKYVDVVTGCHVKTCVSESCTPSSSFSLFGISNPVACSAMPPSACLVDSDCQQRVIRTWREVRP